VAVTKLPTSHGRDFTAILYANDIDRMNHIALVKAISSLTMRSLCGCTNNNHPVQHSHPAQVGHASSAVTSRLKHPLEDRKIGQVELRDQSVTRNCENRPVRETTHEAAPRSQMHKHNDSSSPDIPYL